MARPLTGSGTFFAAPLYFAVASASKVWLLMPSFSRVHPNNESLLISTFLLFLEMTHKITKNCLKIALLADVKKLQRDCGESGPELKRRINEKTAGNANKYAKEQRQLQKRQANEVSFFDFFLEKQ